MNIFVGNLSFDAAGGDVKKLFEGFGKVASAVIVTRKEKKGPKPRGFGFVEMPDESQARGAIAALNGKEFMGRVLKVNPARLKKEVQRDSKPGKKAWPKVMADTRRYSREEREQRKPWINPVFNKSGTHRGPRSAGSYMKRDGSTEMREETNPWRKREYQSRPWRKSQGEREPWKKAEKGEGRPLRKAEGKAQLWSKREDRPRPWQESPSGHKPWKRAEERARRPWKKAEGARLKPWIKSSERPRRSGFESKRKTG